MKKIAILGLARSGLSSYNHYIKKGFSVVAWDEDIKKISNLKTTYNLLDYTNWNYKELDFIIVSPGIPLKYPEKHLVLSRAEKFNIPIYCDVELFIAENPHIKYIAITGTNGKSTTTAIVQDIFSKHGMKSAYAGNIGVPIFDINPNVYDYLILELSSYQLELMHHVKFSCAACTNLQEDHIDYHGNFHNYKLAKYKIFNNQTKDSMAIMPKEVRNDLKSTLTSKVIIIGDSHAKGIGISEGKLIDNYYMDNKVVLDFKSLEFLKGHHNYQNVAFAYAIARFYGIREDFIAQYIRSFKGLMHRQQFIRKINDIIFINDSKGTNQQSTLEALRAYDNIYLILGGVRKSDTLDIILPYFNKVKHVFLIGKSTEIFAKIMIDNKIIFSIAENLKHAVFLAYGIAKKNPLPATVLLSPACASFDEFLSFEDRGEQFISLVECLQ